MSVRFQLFNEALPIYLTPAPFVNITKEFDKQGDGEILGARYAITLSGTLVADRGSPTHQGLFLNTAADHIHDLDGDGTSGAEPERLWYKSIQRKQKALMRLVSKLYEGSYLEIDPPSEDGTNGFKAYVRLESIDLPAHEPGNPYKSDYTINLSADVLLGPDGNSDLDNWPAAGKWLVSSASETWGIEETDRSVFHRGLINGKDFIFRPAGVAAGGQKGGVISTNKTYLLTRNISATGKSEFNSSTSVGGYKADLYSTNYKNGGKAWQQARGFVYDIIKYGNRFLFGYDGFNNQVSANAGGADDTEYTGGIHNNLVALAADDDDVHLFGMNLPVPGNNAVGAYDNYKAYNYKRIQNVDIRSGQFSVVETWILAPYIDPADGEIEATETLDVQVSEDSEGKVTVSINGSIEGLVDNADDAGVGDKDNQDRDPDDVLNVKENYDRDQANSNTKYGRALSHYSKIMPFMHRSAAMIVKELPEYAAYTISPTLANKSVTSQPANGTITFNLSYEGRVAEYHWIPYCKSEDWSVNDTYPGQVVASHVVLGRRLGPVLQGINTQTQWQRDLSISATFDTGHYEICVDSNNQYLAAPKDKATCNATVDEFGVAASWIENPNHADIAVALGNDDFTHELILAKPGNDIISTTTGNPLGGLLKKDTRLIQANAIKKLIDSFDPASYLTTIDHSKYTLTGNTPPKRVRKRFLNPPSESWNPVTGTWSYNLSWIYEINDPWAFPTDDYVDKVNGVVNPDQDDKKDQPYSGQEM